MLTEYGEGRAEGGDHIVDGDRLVSVEKRKCGSLDGIEKGSAVSASDVEELSDGTDGAERKTQLGKGHFC